MEQQLIVKLHKDFEDYAHQQDGVDFWYARDLQTLLGYDKWSNFEGVINKAKLSCYNAGEKIENHFADAGKMVGTGSGAQREIDDLVLTRYACYLIAQNGDPRKDEIAFAQTYFAVQTRKQEVVERRLAEVERLEARGKLTASEKELSGLLYERGVDSQGFARIRSKGDMALFGGNTTQDMKLRLNVPSGRALADFLPTVTIKAKDLANEITNHNVRTNHGLRGEEAVTHEHVRNNENMREMLGKSGIRPELLPPEEDAKKLERRLKSEGKKLPKSSPKLGKK
jgi:DNA-damage-inducible protein D